MGYFQELQQIEYFQEQHKLIHVGCFQPSGAAQAPTDRILPAAEHADEDD